MSTAPESVEDRIKKLIAFRMKVDRKVLTRESHLENVIGMDGLDRLDVGISIEDEYGIEFGDADFECNTIGDLVDLTEARIAAQPKRAVG